MLYIAFNRMQKREMKTQLPILLSLLFVVLCSWLSALSAWCLALGA